MRTEFTIAARHGSQDVAVAAPDDLPLAAIRAALAAAAGVDDGVPLWLGERALTGETPLSEIAFGAKLRAGRPGSGPPTSGVLSLQIVGGPDAGLVMPLGRGRLCLGRDVSCDVRLVDADVSRRHALIDVRDTGITLHDLGSTNGTRVDGEPVEPSGVPLRPGCLIAIGDSLLTVTGPAETPATLQPAPDGKKLMLRPPRRSASVPQPEIELPVRASSLQPRGVQWITALLPAAAGGAIAWFMHAPQFLLFALLSPVMMISTALGDRLHWRRSRRRDAATFRRRRAAAELQLRDALLAETAARRARAPDPAALLRHAALPSSRLWERRRDDADLLQLRVGTADLPSATRIRKGSQVGAAGTARAVPLTVDLRAGPVGVTGPAGVLAGLGRSLVGQLAALHSPLDVELGFLLSDESAEQWTWARWLPHLRGQVASGAQECAGLVSELCDAVQARLTSRRLDPDGWGGRWLVLVVDRTGELADVPGLAALLASGPAAGVSAICLDTDAAALPTSCATVARVCGDTGSHIAVRSGDGPAVSGVSDQVSTPWATTVARSLARLIDPGTRGEAALPQRCLLGEVLELADFEPAAIARRWAASDGGARTVIGSGADGTVTLDLVADGPHALIAGTTGSGKSELLQSLVAGLAASHPPDELNVLLIDYKGGAAFAECAQMPHVAGLVTDLDPYLTERALRSLNSELRRRERLFATVGAADLDSYRAARPVERVSRLVIVVDEFATLVEELPEFVRGLVGIAQRGRSLGVHLVLATQRPGSAVSADIRANTSLRIALRVTDPGESTDVIDVPDAATISRSCPGRAYLRTGTTSVRFQAARASGASVRPGIATVRPLGPWRRELAASAAEPDATDVSRLVAAVSAAARDGGLHAARSPWLAPLPEQLAAADLPAPSSEAEVPLALVDLPDEQRRESFMVDLAGTSLLVAGAARSGRTTALATLAIGAASRLGPDDLQLFALDAAGDLRDAVGTLPHCATALGPDDLDLAPRLLDRLNRECARRLTGRSPGGSPRDRLLLVVDGWTAVLAGLTDADAAGCADLLAGLLRVGGATALSVAVTGDRAALAPRFAGGFTSRVLLRMPDRSDYGLAGVAARDVPAGLPPGRGLRVGDGAVLQVAHPGARSDAGAMRDAAAVIAQNWSPAASRHARIRIQPLPGRVRLDDLPEDGSRRLTLGLAGDEVDALRVDPFDGSLRMLVAGPPRSGRTTLLTLLARQAHALGLATVIAAASRSPLGVTARELGMPVITPAHAEAPPVPGVPTLLLVDDGESFTDSAAGERLTGWLRADAAPVAAVVAGRTDDLATSYRGLAAEVRRHHCGVLLRPGPVDGELLGVRLPRRHGSGPPGRGVVVGDPRWGPMFAEGEPVPIQVAIP
ncbi:MAG TPA: FtsK/SpoIIIE domain-containing protein [Jatrophihabitans sp.]|nr:FtsK/SpoIIIE domain-containing protein [Jatrophihabitans sp.]